MAKRGRLAGERVKDWRRLIHSPGLLVNILAFALVIGPLVFLHELGHYLAGRLFG